MELKIESLLYWYAKGLTIIRQPTNKFLLNNNPKYRVVTIYRFKMNAAPSPPPKAAEIFGILSVKQRSNSSQGCSAWHILRLLAISSFLQAIQPAIGDKVQELVPLQRIILHRYDDMDCRL